MKKMSLKAYAVKHKLSIFNVMKMVKSHKLDVVVEKENGKEITYIVLDDITEKEVEKSILPLKEKKGSVVMDELNQLKEEIVNLRDEIEMLKKAIN